MSKLIEWWESWSPSYHAFKAWQKFHASFHSSETIFIARVKILIGGGFTALQQSGVDVAGFVEDHRIQAGIRIFMAYLVFDGTLGEWARRRNATPDFYDPSKAPPVNPAEQ